MVRVIKPANKPELVGPCIAYKTVSNEDPLMSYITLDFGGVDNEAYCTCPGFKYRQNCRHIQEIANVG